MELDMRGVLIEVPASLLAERHRLGVDRFDEMWEGELHMVPPASEEHQRIGGKLHIALEPAAAAVGLLLRYETGLFDPGAESDSSYRVPDLVAFAPEFRSARGVEGSAALVIEIRSPGDEAYDKIPFYRRVGVGEILIVDRDSKEVRRWVRAGDELSEAHAGDDGWHSLGALPVRFRSEGGTLTVEGPAGTTSI
ncbi:MAG: Uma2 family endonuclease [Actinomycetota bacterium]|nr:Uma2 family endonuclease [Actinomycetota bacterium]